MLSMKPAIVNFGSVKVDGTSEGVWVRRKLIRNLDMITVCNLRLFEVSLRVVGIERRHTLDRDR